MSHKRYFSPVVEIKEGNVFIDEIDPCDQPVKNYIKAYDNILKIANGIEDDYTSVCMLDYQLFTS